MHSKKTHERVLEYHAERSRDVQVSQKRATYQQPSLTVFTHLPWTYDKNTRRVATRSFCCSLSQRTCGRNQKFPYASPGALLCDAEQAEVRIDVLVAAVRHPGPADMHAAHQRLAVVAFRFLGHEEDVVGRFHQGHDCRSHTTRIRHGAGAQARRGLFAGGQVINVLLSEVETAKKVDIHGSKHDT